MKRHLLRWIMITSGLVLLALGNGVGVLAQKPGDMVYITTPTDGAAVSGLMTVTGTAAFPNFLKYEIFLKPGKGEMLWVATVYSPVVNGNLARWDTRTYQNGAYQMVVRQVGTDSNYTDFYGPNVMIDNPQGAPLPYPEIESSYLYPPEQNALARVRNCAGADMKFDYMSPVGFHSSGEFWLKGKPMEAKFCQYEDFILTPGEYRGTAAADGDKAYTFAFQAEAGKIYEIAYNGQAAGRNQLVINTIEGDKRAATDTGGGAVAATGATAAIVAPAASEVSASAPAAPEPVVAEPPAAPEQKQSMLPVTGQGQSLQVPLVLVGMGLVLCLMLAGVVGLIFARQRNLLG